MPQCICIKTSGQQCSKPAARGDDHCGYHRRIMNNGNERVAVNQVMIDVLNQIWGNGVRDEAFLIAMIDTAFENGSFSGEWRDVLVEDVRDELEIMNVVERTTPTQTELQRLASDSQNVHTGPVNKQTKANEEILLSTPVPTNPNTLKEISNKLCNKKVVKDINKWYNAKTCRNTNDYLYKRLLDTLWIRIKSSEHKEELTKRLQEETLESLKMCCEGHISRLCNVLVGFDDEFKAVVSTGELLQQKIAGIANKDIGVEYKVGEAWIIFEELGIPIEERNAWIEAF